MGDQENVSKSFSKQCTKYEAELRLIGKLQLLQNTNQDLKEEKEKWSKENSDLRNQIAAHEVTIQQYKHFCDEKKADKIKAVSSQKLLKKKEKEISKLKDDVSRLKNLVQEKKNEVKKRKALYRKAVLHVERFVKNIEKSGILNDEKLAKSCQKFLEKMKRFRTMCPDDIEGSFDSEAEDGRRIEDLLYSDIEASPVTRSSHVAVINPQYETKSNLSHGTSGAECTTAGTKDKKDHAFTQHASLNRNENVCSVVNNGHLQLECISATTSAVVIHQQVSNCDPPLCNNVCGNSSLGEISNPSSFKNLVVDNSDVQYIQNQVGKKSNVCEATSNQDLFSKNGNYIEADNIFLDDFSSDFAEMKSQICLEKEMSFLVPLPPTRLPRSSALPDTFHDRCANTTCNDKPQGRSTERHRTIPWSKNLLHQPSEGFESSFDDLINGSNNEYLQQQRQSTSYLQPSSEREGNNNVLKVNRTSADKSSKACIAYDDKAGCFLLSANPQSKDTVMIKPWKYGIISFGWQNFTACRNVHENQDKKVPSEERVSLQHSIDQEVKDVSKETSVPAKKLKQIRLKVSVAPLQSDEGDTSPKLSDISGLNSKREDMTAEHHSGCTISLKSPKNSSPNEIYSPSLPPCKLSKVNEGESLTSQSELCNLETHVVHPPKKLKRSVSLATHSKVRKVSSMNNGTNSLKRGLECQETIEVISSGESHVAFTTALGHVDADDLNKTKLQDSGSPNGSAGSVFSGNAQSPEQIHSPTLPPTKLRRADEDESLSLTELHDLDTKAEQPGKHMFPQKKKKLAKAPHTHERSNQNNCEYNLRSSKQLHMTELRSLKPVLPTSSSHKSYNSSIKSENVMKTKKKCEAKKQFSEESIYSPDKPSIPDFVQARFQKITNLNSLGEILEPVKPKNFNSNKRKRLEMSCTPLSNGAVNGNIQNGSHKVQAASLPEHECVVDNIPVNGEPVISDNNEDSDLPTGNETQTVGNKVVDVAGVNGIKQTLTATNESQNDGKIDMVDVEQNINEQNISNLENSQNTKDANFPLSGVGSKTVVVTVATVHKGIDCDVSSSMCNSDQESIVTLSPYEIPGATNQLNGYANVYGAGDVNTKVAVNGESEEDLASHAVRKKDWSTNCVPVFDSVLTEKNDHSESLEQKCISSVENKDPFISPLCDDDNFRSGLGNVGINPVLCKHLETLKKASSFNCFGLKRVLMTALCNPVVVPNVQEAVSTIVHFLSSCDDDPFLNEVEASDINPPVIFSYEEYLVDCVFQVQGEDKPHLKNFLHVLFSVIERQIIFNKSLKLCGATSLCRVFTKLHKISNDLVGPKVLCYNILDAYPDACNVPYLLAAIVGVWPKVLEFEEVFQGTKNKKNLSISSILFNRSCAYNDGATKCLQVIRHLSKLCPENLPSLSTDVV